MPAAPDARVPIPPALRAHLVGRAAEGGPTGDDWLAALPRLAAAALDRWELDLDGEPRHGYAALVLPVRRSGTPLMLKIAWPHEDGRHEHLALRAWAGRGAVQLVAAHPGDGALLLERLHPEADLGSLGVADACTELGRLARRLTVPAFPQLRRLSDWTRRFLADTADVTAIAAAGLPRRFLEQARSLAGDLATEPGLDGSLVHADLHDGNVLAADRAPWLAIDPHPLAGETAFCLAPALWNRWDDALASGDPTWHLKLRLLWLAEAAEVDEDRARAWSLLRLVDHAAWRVRRPDPEAGPAPMSAVVTACKAMASDR